MDTNPTSVPVRGNLNIAILAGAVCAAALFLWIASSTSSPFIVVLAAIGFGLTGNTLFALMHEAVHGIFHRNTVVNEAAGNIAAAFFPTIFVVQRLSHLTHHENNRSDVERFDYFENRDSHFLKTAQWYSILTGLYWLFIPVMLTIYTIFGNLIPWRKFLATDGVIGRQTSAKPYFEALRAIKSWQIYLGFALAVAVQALMIWGLGLNLIGWAACYAAFGLMWSSQQYADHAFSVLDRINGSWNLQVNKPVKLAYLNYHYHLCHHREPQTPWYLLPQAVRPDDKSVGFLQMLLFMWTGPRQLPGQSVSMRARKQHDITVNLFLTAVMGVFFLLTYGAGSAFYLATTHHYSVVLPLDAYIPYIPQTAILYLAIGPVMLAAPFIFRTPEKLVPFGLALAVQLVIALAVFIIFPTEIPEPAYTDTGLTGFLMSLLDMLNLYGNNLPSLHVAMVISAAWGYSRFINRPWQILLWVLSFAIVVSTLLTHQHVIMDVFGGLLLAIIGMGFVYPAASRSISEMHRFLGTAVDQSCST